MSLKKIFFSVLLILVVLFGFSGCAQTTTVNTLTEEEISRVEKRSIDFMRSRTYETTWEIKKQEYNQDHTLYIVYVSNGEKAYKLMYDLPLTQDFQGRLEEWDDEE